MSNTVTLTIAGNPAPAQDAFRQVGKSSEDMAEKVHQSGQAFDDAAERSDALDTRAMGFRDTLTGIQDGAVGVKQAAAGNWGFETLLLLGTGIGDLASGFTNFLIPAVKAMTAAKWLENAAWLASPITWIIIGIIALVAVIVLIATKTDWFSKAWSASWKWIKESASNVWEWLKKVPGWIGDAFRVVATAITAPFRIAFNFIADAWNNTVGRLSWSVPAWIPGIGGNSISVPHIPKFHSGGVVPGIPGSETLAVLQAGERVSTRGSGASTTIEIRSGGSMIDDALVELMSRAIRNSGGDVQLAVGGRNGRR
jgi:hypothetical protein